MKTGIAYLPLHSGKAPEWLLNRMSKLAGLIVELIVREYGGKTLIEKLSDPFWFQALGCFLGFDWHSSGLTTTLCFAIKRGIKYREKELGVFIAGGKGRYALSTPEEIKEYGFKYGFNPSFFIYASRMSAKVDSICLQDGFSLYQHMIVFTPQGDWTVIQQGMNPEIKLARRYHWLGDKNKDFIVEPHSGVICPEKTQVLNLTAQESRPSRTGIASLVKERTSGLVVEYKKAKKLQLGLKFNYNVNLDLKRFEAAIVKIKENNPESFTKIIETPGIGPATVRALTLLAHLIYGAEPSFRDPAVYSYAHGGKDGIPYPVNKNYYDRTAKILRDFLRKAEPESKMDIKEFLKITI
jgi:hypothetical protein